jgi:thiosulfate dehydrogenase (quinone) large subunit
MKKNSDKIELIWAIVRIALGLIFLWAFFDKLIGLGFSTCLNSETGITEYKCEKAWISGGSPTSGFLGNSPKGPFAEIFKSMAGSGVVDWLFMLGLFGIGLTLTFGFAVRLGSISGIALMFLMWLAVLPPKNHPFLDDHIIYLLVLLVFAIKPPKRLVCRMWHNLKFVKKNKILE